MMKISMQSMIMIESLNQPIGRKKKEVFIMKNFKRFIATVFTVMTITIMASFTMTSASAAVVEPTATTASVTMISRTNSLSIPIPSFPNLKMDEEVVETGSSYNAEQGFSSIVNFFVTWIQKVGGLVALVGGIMFCLAIKNNDAEQKQSGLLTLVAGFAVIAICGAISYFGL